MDWRIRRHFSDYRFITATVYIFWYFQIDDDFLVQSAFFDRDSKLAYARFWECDFLLNVEAKFHCDSKLGISIKFRVDGCFWYTSFDLKTYLNFVQLFSFNEFFYLWFVLNRFTIWIKIISMLSPWVMFMSHQSWIISEVISHREI